MNLDYSETNLLVAGFKKSAKILKFNSQRIGRKVQHSENQHDSLNQFEYFEIKIAQKIYANT